MTNLKSKCCGKKAYPNLDHTKYRCSGCYNPCDLEENKAKEPINSFEAEVIKKFREELKVYYKGILPDEYIKNIWFENFISQALKDQRQSIGLEFKEFVKNEQGNGFIYTEKIKEVVKRILGVSI